MLQNLCNLLHAYYGADIVCAIAHKTNLVIANVCVGFPDTFASWSMDHFYGMTLVVSGVHCATS